VHGTLDRRGFLDRAQKFATVGMSAGALLAALSPNFALGQQVAKDDRRISTQWVEYPSPQGNGSIKGYLARRLATDGFMAFAPDALTPLGGYPGDEDKASENFAKLDQGKALQDFLAGAAWLKARPDSSGKLGVVGFCYGGGMVHMLTTRMPDIAAGVPFYGNVPATSEAAKVKTPLLLHFAGTDERINAAWPAYEAALQAAGVPFQANSYPGTQHGFNNDTTPRYDAASAKVAWEKTVAFFNERLKGERPRAG